MTHTSKINGREFLFVEVPEDAYGFRIDTELDRLIFCKGKESFNLICDAYVRLAPYPYRILCKASEAGDGIAESIVRRSRFIPNKPDSPFCYFDYCNTGTWFLTATESLHSLILSLGMEVNKTIILEKVK